MPKLENGPRQATKQKFNIIEPMARGYPFYRSFWEFDYEPLFLVVKNCLNFQHYETMNVVEHAGVHEWLWPCVSVRGPEALYVVLDLIRRTHCLADPVPWDFAKELLGLYSRWQPKNRL